jgi:hypothetical protein
MNLPLQHTTGARGSTRCPGCEKRFADTAEQPTTDYPVDEAYTRRGSVHLGETRRVLYRWHNACREEAERFNAESRARAAAEHERTMRELCEETGVDYDEIKKRIDERNRES